MWCRCLKKSIMSSSRRGILGEDRFCWIMINKSAPATMVAKNQCLTCCLTCCFWCWFSHWVLLILSWNMWLRGRSGGLWLGRDPGGVGGSVKIGDWVFDLVGIFPWLRSFGLTFRLLVLREYSYLGVYLSAVTIWCMPFVLVSCC